MASMALMASMASRGVQRVAATASRGPRPPRRRRGDGDSSRGQARDAGKQTWCPGRSPDRRLMARSSFRKSICMPAAASSSGKHMLWFAQPQIVVQRLSKPASAPGACSGFRKSSQTSVRAQYQGPAHSSAVGGARVPPDAFATAAPSSMHWRSQSTRAGRYISLPWRHCAELCMGFDV